MSCESMLLQLLEAEPEELRSLADTPLARHLAECPRCAAVADRLLADTAQLAFAVRAGASITARPARRVSRLWFVPAAVAAAMAVVLWRGGESPTRPPASADAVLIAPPPPPSATTVAVETPRAVETVPRRTAPSPRPIRVRPLPQQVAFRVEPVVVEPMPLPTPVTVTPMAIDRRGRAANARGLETPEAGSTKRATILRSAVPGVTVIWLN